MPVTSPCSQHCYLCVCVCVCVCARAHTRARTGVLLGAVTSFQRLYYVEQRASGVRQSPNASSV